MEDLASSCELNFSQQCHSYTKHWIRDVSLCLYSVCKIGRRPKPSFVACCSSIASVLYILFIHFVYRFSIYTCKILEHPHLISQCEGVFCFHSVPWTVWACLAIDWYMPSSLDSCQTHLLPLLCMVATSLDGVVETPWSVELFANPVSFQHCTHVHLVLFSSPLFP